MTDEPRSLGDSLDALRRELGMREPGDVERAQAAWEELAGPELAAHVRAVTVRDGVLVLRADAPAWAGQVRYLESALLQALAAALPTGAVARVRVTVARASERGPDDP